MNATRTLRHSLRMSPDRFLRPRLPLCLLARIHAVPENREISVGSSRAGRSLTPRVGMDHVFTSSAHFVAGFTLFSEYSTKPLESTESRLPWPGMAGTHGPCNPHDDRRRLLKVQAALNDAFPTGIDRDELVT